MLDEQVVEMLRKPLDAERVITGSAGPLRGVRYLEGHDVIRTANEIFGFGRWQFEILQLPVMIEEGTQGQNQTFYQVWMVHGRLTVDGCLSVEDIGTNTRNGQGSNGLEMAIKGAVTDCLKRCFKMFGDQFGLVLYDKLGTSSSAHGVIEDVPEVPAEILALKSLLDTAKDKGIGLQWLILALGGPKMPDSASAQAWWKDNAQRCIGEKMAGGATVERLVSAAADAKASE